jgi:CTP:molybdopterin cytidylyltransferase MocA
MTSTKLGAVIMASNPGAEPWASTLGGRSTLEEHVASLRRAHIGDIAVIQPLDAPALPPRLGGLHLILQPPEWSGAFSALVLGLFAIERETVLIIPADHEVIADQTMRQIVLEARHGRVSHALVPTFHQRRGYPVVLFRAGIEAIVREAARPCGARQLESLLDLWSTNVCALAVTDDAVTHEFIAARA